MSAATMETAASAEPTGMEPPTALDSATCESTAVRAAARDPMP